MQLDVFGVGVRQMQGGALFYLYSGIASIACFAIVHCYLYMRLRDTGYNKHIFNFLLIEVPMDYLRLRAKYGWSPWPAYLMWPVLIIGVVLFVIGVSRL